MTSLNKIKEFLRGEIAEDDETRDRYSRDASLFEIKPKAVIFPKDTEDVKNLVKYVVKEKQNDPGLSLTARGGGSDMTGGPLTESLVLDFTRHFNRIEEVGNDYSVMESGVYYRDFEKETLKKDLLLPTYPASREMCALGGMIANNAGGEKSLIYGQTKDYVEELKVVLSDGEEHSFSKINKQELDKKKEQPGLEGQIYKKVYDLLDKNFSLVKSSRPNVSKNSSGYNIWDVWDGENFNMAKIFVGAQGTLGLITEAKIRLVKKKSHSGMMVVFLKDIGILADLVSAVLPFRPSSFESFDDNTLRLSLQSFRGFLKALGAKNLFTLGWSFLPEFWLILTYGMPKLVLLVEFEEDSQDEVGRKLNELREKLKSFKVKTKIAATAQESRKYWVIRRESFNLLRHKVRGKQMAPFIDDFIVRPEKLPEFLPQLYKILDNHKLFYTIFGHIGDGNFHIVPLMALADEENRKKIPIISEEIYDLVLRYKGSITAEHNDGLIRGAYLRKMYGPEVYKIFEEIKKIFDPLGIFNPGKKVEANMEYALAHMKRE